MAELHPLDLEIRDLLVRPVDDAVFEAAMANARIALAGEMERDVAAEFPARLPRRAVRRPLRLAMTIGAIALALLVTVALDPLGRDGGRDNPAIPQLAANASAAETLEWAGRVLELDKDPFVGEGSVSHSVVVTRRDGEVERVIERWFDTTSDRWRVVEVRRSELLLVSQPGWVIVLQDYDGSILHVRTLIRPDSTGRWEPFEDINYDIVGNEEMSMVFGGPSLRESESQTSSGSRYDGRPYRITANASPEVATRTWLESVSGQRSETELVRATRTFMASTRGHFFVFGADENRQSVQQTSIRQLVYLAQVAPATPSATRVLYRALGDLGRLRRLPDAVVDGEPVSRIEFVALDETSITPNSANPSVGVEVLRRRPAILVLSLRTGALVALETEDRSVSERVTLQERVTGTSANARTCEIVTVIECSIVDWSHPLLASIDARVGTPEALRRASEVRRRTLVPYAVRPDGQPESLDGRPLRPGDVRYDQFGRAIPLLPFDPRVPDPDDPPGAWPPRGPTDTVSSP